MHLPDSTDNQIPSDKVRSMLNPGEKSADSFYPFWHSHMCNISHYPYLYAHLSCGKSNTVAIPEYLQFEFQPYLDIHYSISANTEYTLQILCNAYAYGAYASPLLPIHPGNSTIP